MTKSRMIWRFVWAKKSQRCTIFIFLTVTDEMVRGLMSDLRAHNCIFVQRAFPRLKIAARSLSRFVWLNFCIRAETGDVFRCANRLKSLNFRATYTGLYGQLVLSRISVIHSAPSALNILLKGIKSPLWSSERKAWFFSFSILAILEGTTREETLQYHFPWMELCKVEIFMAAL